MEASECIPELDATRTSCHSSQTWTIPIDFSALQNQTSRWFSGRKFDSAWKLMILFGDKKDLVFAVLNVAGR